MHKHPTVPGTMTPPTTLDEFPALTSQQPTAPPAATRKRKKKIVRSDNSALNYATITAAFFLRFALGLFRRRYSQRSTSSGTSNDLGSYPFSHHRLDKARIILPLDWRTWISKLDVVLVHEPAHVRRHDGLVPPLPTSTVASSGSPRRLFLARKLALLTRTGLR